MYDRDKDEFGELMRRLCAGYDIGYTDMRRDAYFGGLEKMSLAQFSQCVDHLLGPDSIFPEKIPKAPQMWKVWNTVKSYRAKVEAPPAEEPKLPDHPHMRLWVDNMFFIYLNRRRRLEGFKGDINLAERRRQCLDLAEYLTGMTEEDMKPTLEEAKDMFNRTMARVADGE